LFFGKKKGGIMR